MNKIPDDFKWKEYVLLNPDLAESNMDTEHQAMFHYINYGVNENRKYKFDSNNILPEDFNAKIYRFLNSDLFHLTDLQATQHYINHGKQENRSYKCSFGFDNNFDPRLYKLYNADLAHLTDIQALQHYSEHGHREGRTYYTGVSFDTLMQQKHQQNVGGSIKNGVMLINHDISLTGAPLFLYDLYDYLAEHNIFKNIVIVEPYPNNILPQAPNKLYHFNDPQNLMSLIENMDPVLIYSNSLNLYARNLSIFYYWIYKTIFHFHETYEPYSRFIDKNISLQAASVKVVSEKIKQEFLANQTFNNISVFPPFLSYKKLAKIDHDYKLVCYVRNIYREINTDKVIVGMSGSLCDRKNFSLFYLLAKACPDIEFVWIGGQNLDEYLIKTLGHIAKDIPNNFFWIENTSNPYKYFDILDYFFLTSQSDPCPLVVLENLYLNNKVIVLKNNIHTEHDESQLENFINIDNDTNDTVDDIIIKFKQLQLNKQDNQTNKNKEYIITNYSKPQNFCITSSQKNHNNNYFVCSLYEAKPGDVNLSYYINLINQFIIRNEYSYKVIVALAYDEQYNQETVKELYSKLINIDQVLLKDNRGYDIGGLIDAINYIYSSYAIDENSRICYTHSKSNIHWRNLNDKIFYVDNVGDFDTISTDRFTTYCGMDDMNRPLFSEYPHVFDSTEMASGEFRYIQGTVFRSKTMYLKTLYDKYDNIKPILTHKDKDDIYWQSIMKNETLFNNYVAQYSNNIFNNPININSSKIIFNNLAKNYIELYQKFNLRGIPDCQIEHAIERYIGYLLTNNKKVYCYAA